MGEGDAAIAGCRPILFVTDPDTSIRFYCDVLGFELVQRWSTPRQRLLEADESIPTDFALIERDTVQFMLQRSLLPNNMWLHLDVHSAEQLDTLHAEWAERGANITDAPTLRPWGKYEMRVVDLDGHTFRVSAPPPSNG